MNGETDRGPWIPTFIGHQFHPYDPRPDEVDIADIAHALANLCRFNGHTSDFFSVAQHSVLVSEKASDCLKLPALLHDAAEAYIGDMSGPLKDFVSIMHAKPNSAPGKVCDPFRVAERYILDAIGSAFGISLVPTLNTVKEIDRRMCVTEAKALMRHPGPWFEQAGLDAEPEPYDDVPIHPQTPDEAEVDFIDTFEQLVKAPPTLPTEVPRAQAVTA